MQDTVLFQARRNRLIATIRVESGVTLKIAAPLAALEPG